MDNCSFEDKKIVGYISNIMLDEMNNQIVVYIKEINEEKKQHVKNYLLNKIQDVNMLSFENGEETIECSLDSTHIYPGQSINVYKYIDNEPYPIRGSIGFKVKYTNNSGITNYGVVTAGHLLSGAIGGKVYVIPYGKSGKESNLVCIGKTYQTFYNSGLDAAMFKITNSSFHLSKQMYYGKSDAVKTTTNQYIGQIGTGGVYYTVPNWSP